MTDRKAPNGPAPPLRFYSFVLAVADLPLMQCWYQAVLGLTERLSGGSEAAGPRFAVLEGAGTCIELVAKAGSAPPPRPLSEQSDDLGAVGWSTLDLETDDLAGLDRHLGAHGVTILSSRRVVAPGRAMTMIRDPEGNRIAFFGPPA